MITVRYLFEKITPDPKAIDRIEESLNVKLPEHYKKFVETFGAIDSEDLCIYGSWKKDLAIDLPSVIGYTKILRESIHLPDEFIAIQSEGSDEILLNTENGYIYKWYESMDKILPIMELDSFKDFLKEKGILVDT
jgi:hypothetical protein